MNAPERDYHVPPINIEAEQALLGAMLHNAAAIDLIDGIAIADDFSEPLHSFLFEKLQTLYNEGRAITPVIVRACLGEYDAEPLVAGCKVTIGEYVGRLYAEAVSIACARDYARTVRDLADRRRIAAALADLDAATRGGELAPHEIAAAGIDALDAIASTRAETNTPRVTVAQAADASLRRMTYAMQHPGELPGMTWGLRDLDERTGGLHRGELVVIAARPSMGKTALAITCARLSATAGNDALFNSLEMNDVALADRMLAAVAFDHREPIEFSRIRRGALSDGEAMRIIDAERRLRTVPLEIDPQPALNISQIASRARRHQQRLERKGRRLGSLWIDHLHLVRASERYKGNRTAEVTEISGALKALAKDLDIAVVTLAQLSRQPENREDKRPILADLRDSGSIEQDADTIIFLFRQSYYLERMAFADKVEDGNRLAALAEVTNQLEATIAKQRNGPIGTVQLFYDAGCNVFDNAAVRS
jgi:replicative DNA helicase